MKKTISLLLILSFFISANAQNEVLNDTIWQKNKSNFAPTEKLAFLDIKITNDRLFPLKNTDIFLVNKKSHKVYANTTSENGKVYFLVPTGKTYELNLLKDKAYRTIVLKNIENLTKRIGFTYVPNKKINEHWELTTLEDIGKFDTIVQNVKVNQRPTQTKAVIHILLFDLDGNKQRGVNVTLMDRKNNIIYKSHTHANGIADFFVPNGKTYIIGVGLNSMFSMLDVENLPNIEGTKRFVYEATVINEFEKNDTITQTLRRNQKSTSDRVFVEAHIENLSGYPLVNEKFMMRSRKSGKVYFGKSNKSGVVNFLLPKGDTYYISFEYRNNKDSVEFKYNNDFNRLRINYQYIGSEKYRIRKLERERMAKIRDSLYKIKRYRDSLRLELLGSENFLEQLEWGKSKEKVKTLIEKRALIEKKQLAKDPKFYEKAGREIQAVLQRIGYKWHNKVIVTDLTGSMYPYIDQILVWHAFKNMSDKNSSYIFFNDGDDKEISEKIIGKTGGIYISKNNSMDEILNSMLETMKSGSGAEIPENDLEALLQGQKLLKQGGSLILIADNLSDVRDLELLKYLHVPVRVILCGFNGQINEHYLEIAYATGGSVHTIEDDIMNLRSLSKGKTLTIKGEKYLFNKGKFLKINN